MRPKPSLIFGEGMSWLLQLSQAQLFTFPLSEQSCLRPAAWWRVYVWARVCPRASMHGYWQGALATQLIPGSGDTNSGAQVNWEPLARRATRFSFVKQISPLVIVVREDIYYGVIYTYSLSLRVSMSPLVQRGSREPEEKVQLMCALLHDWCVPPFGLGKHLLYHNTLHAMTVYLLRSRCPKC